MTMADKSYAEHLASPAFMVMRDGQCDAIWGTKALADREARDLRKLGFHGVEVKAFASWREAHAFEDRLMGDVGEA